MYMQGVYSLISAVPAGSSLYSLPIARGFTRLSAIYVTFWGGADKWVNCFFHPSAGQANTTAANTLEYNMTIGAERWPSFSAESTQEAFLRLTTAAHMGSDLSSITPFQHRGFKFIIGPSFEKAPGHSSHTASTPARARS